MEEKKTRMLTRSINPHPRQDAPVLLPGGYRQRQGIIIFLFLTKIRNIFQTKGIKNNVTNIHEPLIQPNIWNE